jgi:hypothetical protein
MKPRFVSAVAVLFCCAVVGIVGLFGYWRYRKAEEANAAFRMQLIYGTQGPPMGAHMPGQLPPRATNANAGATPQPAQ